MILIFYVMWDYLLLFLWAGGVVTFGGFDRMIQIVIVDHHLSENVRRT